MIRALSSFLALMLVAPSTAQTTQVSDFVSPCPDVFSYDPLATESNKWFGVINLTTDTPLYALWLNIVLESKANIIGNWLGEVTTNDNIDFKIENTNMTITPGKPLAVRFFVQYNADASPPKLKAIRFNGREICGFEPQVVQSAVPVRAIVSNEELRPKATTSTTVAPTTVRVVTTTSRNFNQQQTTTKAQNWFQTAPEPTTTTTLKPLYWRERQTTENTVRTQQTQYWQPTTPPSKPIGTQATAEVNPQSTVRTPAWSYVKADNKQQITSAVKPTNQTRYQTTLHTITGNNSQTKDRNRTTYSQEQLRRDQQIAFGNLYNTQNEIRQQITERAPVWPNVAADNQNFSAKETRPSNFQIEVTQVGNTKYWSKIPENTTRSPMKTPSETESTSYVWSGNQQREPDSELQNQSYAKISFNQAQSTQNFDKPRDTPLYVKPIEEQTIYYDSRYEPKNEQPYSGIRSENRQPARPVNSYQVTTAPRQQITDEVRPLKISGQNSVQRYDQPWVEPARNGMVIQSGVNPSRYPTNVGSLFERPVSSHNKFEEDNSKQDETYQGGLPIFYIPNFGPQSTAEPTCGKVLIKKGADQNLNSTSTYEGQWPWQTAIYQQQMSLELHYKYACGGTLVSKRHIITAAHCVTKKSSNRLISNSSVAVFLGKHNLRTTIDGLQLKFVLKISIYPDYDPTFFKADLAILKLRDSAIFSEKIQPACLWPEQETDLQDVVGETGSTVGWGYEITGTPRENLLLLNMEVVDQQTCLGSYPEYISKFISDKTYCAGYRNSGTICNGDSGGGMVFQKGNSWYLRGVVSLSVAREGTHHCGPYHYVIFTDVAKFLPWIHDNMEDDN